MTRLNAALADRYRIERELGQGGMATVYLAEDLKHDRKVALKVLKPELAAVLGAERFVVEIKTTAALQHPHILPLFDSGAADGFLFYVMPFIDGETLRAKLDRETQLGVDDAVRIAREVADALHYAHEHGIVHRDVKPENILLHGGHAMVADFGIALAVSAAAGGRMTETGLSLGTPHYMSPEQATAEKEITARSDVYSLGSVLYEMLTGNPPHVGASAQQIIMKIITTPAELVTVHRKAVPPNVAAAVAKTLEKLPADRFESAKALAEALGNSAYASTGAGTGIFMPGARGGVSLRSFAAVGVVAAIALVAAAWGWIRATSPVPAQVVRYVDAELSDTLRGSRNGASIALSPDGRRVVYRGRGQLYLRDRDQLTSVALPGTENGISPHFSPDGRRVAFCKMSPPSANCSLQIVSLSGGPATTLTNGGGTLAAWGPGGMFYLGGSAGLRRLPETGGTATPFTVLDTAAGEVRHSRPEALPNGKGVLFIVARGTDELEVAVAQATTGAHRRLGLNGIAVRYASGHLVFVTVDGTLMVAPFDQDRMAVTGEARAIDDGLTTQSLGPDLAISSTGTLMYSNGARAVGRDQVVWVDSDGTERPGDAWTADFADLAMSPDGSRLVAGIRVNGVVTLWVREGERGPLARLTEASEGSCEEPAWTPDGRSVAYICRKLQKSAVYLRRADGSMPAELLLPWKGPGRPEDIAWTPDGKTLLVQASTTEGDELYRIRPGVDSVPVPLLATRFSGAKPAVSPDGRWLAYLSNESGRREVHVRPFPDPSGSRTLVSTSGGHDPAWSPSGRELLFVRRKQDASDAEELVSVAVNAAGAAFRVGPERALFSAPNISYWGRTPDGKQFVIVRNTAASVRGGVKVVVVENWFEELRSPAKERR